MSEFRERHLSLNADDLLTYLAVLRTGRYSSAADRLEVNHTTVSRRISRLESVLGGRVLVRGPGGAWEATSLGQRILGAAAQIENAVQSVSAKEFDTSIHGVVRISAPDGFASYMLAPAAARLKHLHPNIAIEIVTVTRHAFQQRSDLDIEIVVGRPQVKRAEIVRLCEFRMGLFASTEYLKHKDIPLDIESLEQHPLIYFVDTMLQVDALDIVPSFVTGQQETVSATSVMTHIALTRAAAGIGLIACFMADEEEELVRVLPEAISIPLEYWLVSRRDTLQRPEVLALIEQISTEVDLRKDTLLG